MLNTTDPSLTISLNSVDKVKSFVNDVVKFTEDFDLLHDRYVIDAKSIMGIFSLDLTSTLTLVIHTNDNNRFEEIKTALSKYIV